MKSNKKVFCPPAFFNVYINNLSVSLNHSGICGSLGGNLINHLCYANDLCLIALSSSGMQCLLDICDKYATGHQLTYNATKSFALYFKPNTHKNRSSRLFCIRKQICC